MCEPLWTFWILRICWLLKLAFWHSKVIYFNTSFKYFIQVVPNSQGVTLNTCLERKTASNWTFRHILCWKTQMDLKAQVGNFCHFRERQEIENTCLMATTKLIHMFIWISALKDRVQVSFTRFWFQQSFWWSSTLFYCFWILSQWKDLFFMESTFFHTPCSSSSCGGCELLFYCHFKW